VIFLDANYFLRYLTQPDHPANQTRHETAKLLFTAIERGDIVATTSEVVLEEVAFVLAARRHYLVPAGKIARYLSAIIHFPGLRLPRGRRSLHLNALSIWADHPSLGFVDALTVATGEAEKLELATFEQ
jgi:predicted nucleic acid-binding protein